MQPIAPPHRQVNAATNDNPMWLSGIAMAHPARMQNFLLGGKDHFPADRAAVEEMSRQLPALREMAWANRVFVSDTVRHLVTGLGVRQFLDIGSGFPTTGGYIHGVAQGIDPCARVVYVDNDPIVAAHARALLMGEPAGRAAFVAGDARDPEALLADPAVFATLDRSEPIALMLAGVLAQLTDPHANALVTTLLNEMPAGSYLTISHPTADFDPAAVAGAALAAQHAELSYRPRTYTEVSAYFTGLDPVAPGVVPMLAWRPPPLAPPDLHSIHHWVGMGRKP